MEREDPRHDQLSSGVGACRKDPDRAVNGRQMPTTG